MVWTAATLARTCRLNENSAALQVIDVVGSRRRGKTSMHDRTNWYGSMRRGNHWCAIVESRKQSYGD